MSQTQVVILIGVVLVLAVVTFFIVRRVRYVRALKSRGWTFESTPQLASVLQHQAPPFGLGFSREVDESITGQTRGGVWFHAFEYAYTGGGPKFDERLVSMLLPVALPDLFVTDQRPRNGVRYSDLQLDPSVGVFALYSDFARDLLTPGFRSAVAAFGQSGHRLDLSIDGQHLVAVGAPKRPEELEAYLEALAPVAASLDPASLQRYAVPPSPPAFAFYRRPDWVLVGTDDTLIDRYGLTTAGFGHRTEKLVRADNSGLPLDAFEHHWKTTRTETSTDSEGRTTTRTVTENHSETVLAVNLPFRFPLLSIGVGTFEGERVRFESEQFNQRFKVRTNNTKFAYDVIHPRTMEWLLSVSTPDFRIEDSVMRFHSTAHDTQVIGFCADFAHHFFSRVPSFVWNNLGTTPPTFRL